MSITANVDIPIGTSSIEISQSRPRLLLTQHRNCIVLIDSIEGPLQSHKRK